MDEVARELIDFKCRLRKSSAYRWVLANPPTILGMNFVRAGRDRSQPARKVRFHFVAKLQAASSNGVSYEFEKNWFHLLQSFGFFLSLGERE